MATVPQPTPSVPVRHGMCRLVLEINGRPYRLRRRRPLAPGEKCWALTHLDGPRAGVTHVVSRYRNSIACSCEDSTMKWSRCKHMRALVAAGLINGRGTPWMGSTRYVPSPAAAASVPARRAEGGA